MIINLKVMQPVQSQSGPLRVFVRLLSREEEDTMCATVLSTLEPTASRCHIFTPTFPSNIPPGRS